MLKSDVYCDGFFMIYDNKSNDMKIAWLWHGLWHITLACKSRSIWKLCVLEKAIAAIRRAIFYSGLASTLVSPSRSPAASTCSNDRFFFLLQNTQLPAKVLEEESWTNGNWMNCCPAVSFIAQFKPFLFFYKSFSKI